MSRPGESQQNPMVTQPTLMGARLLPTTTGLSSICKGRKTARRGSRDGEPQSLEELQRSLRVSSLQEFNAESK
jgi:hypothetical protein